MLNRIIKKPAVRQGSIVLVEQGALSTANFVIGVLVARSGTKEEYGIYVLAWSILMILQGLHRGITSLPFTIYYPRLIGSERAYYQGSTLMHTLMVCVLITFFMFVIYFLFGRSTKDELTSIYTILPALALLLTPFLVREFTRSALLAQQRFYESVVPNLIATLLQVSLVLVYYIFGWITLTNILTILAVTNAFAAFVMLWIQRNSWRIEKKRVWRDFVKNSKIGKWELANGITYMAGYQLYPWLILPLLGTDEVAAYGACIAIANLPAPLLRNASAYILPRMSHGYKDGDFENLMRLLRQSILLFLIPYGLWLLIGSLFGELITTLIYSDKYAGYSSLLFFLLLRVTIESISTPLTTALQAIEKIHVISISGVLGAVITLALAPAAIAYMGVAGAGMVSAFASLIMTLYRWWGLYKHKMQ